ncbi:MmcB family DNA repair protein [Terasakiella sp. SH-1]|uniref:MmcB family DNA repair protein n=1 Tax=Terasakiella sp. SH-1 TaxID=2560057 RepID=UPI001072EF2D|nr:MmcB family DNA repair protein [Terasakiella sp. SH-1]
MTKTAEITQGTQLLLQNMGYACLNEVTLPNDRRADLMGLNKKGQIFIVEVKSSLEDFRSDLKWQDYLDYCDFFAFSVDEDFPKDILPAEHGLIIADKFEGYLHRHSPEHKLNGARRKSLTLSFARTAAKRLEKDQV